jgi:hypothetical protein
MYRSRGPTRPPEPFLADQQLAQLRSGRPLIPGAPEPTVALQRMIELGRWWDAYA